MTAGLRGRDGRRQRVEHRVEPSGSPERPLGRVGFREAAIGFALMTALVVVAATGVFVLLDPRAQLFWGTKLSELGALVRGVLPRTR